MKENYLQKTFSPSTAKTYETSLFNIITTEFGYIGGPDVVKLFVQKICELNREYYKQSDYVKPGEMRYLALKTGQKYSKSKKLSQMQVIPITLSIVTPEDIQDRIDGVKRSTRVKKVIVRFHHQAKEQGAVLSETDDAIITGLATSGISKYVREYEEECNVVIPRPGTEMDMGKTLTHKKLAFQNYKKKISTSKNAKLIDHTPESVDRYIKDGTRIEKLYDEGYEEWDISFLTGLPGYVVKQYVEIIEEYNEKDKFRVEQ